VNFAIPYKIPQLPFCLLQCKSDYIYPASQISLSYQAPNQSSSQKRNFKQPKWLDKYKKLQKDWYQSLYIFKTQLKLDFLTWGDFYLTPAISLRSQHASLHKSVSIHGKVAMLKFELDVR